MIEFVINQFSQLDWFNIITFSDTVDSFKETLINSTYENKTLALEYLNNITF